MTVHGNAAHDGRLDSGMAGQATTLAHVVAAGSHQVGWKAGFGSAAWRDTFGLDAPLVSFLLDTTRLGSTDGTDSDDVATVSIGGWHGPRAEAEIAVRMGIDVPGDAGPDQALSAIGASAPAIEIVDIDPAPTDLGRILSGGIYHRWWCTGAFRSEWRGADLATLTARITAAAPGVVDVPDCQALTGSAGDVLCEVARMAARHGRGLLAGDIVILGSIVPPVAIAPLERFSFTLDHAPALEVRFTE